MRFLMHAGLDAGKMKPALERVRAAIERDDFRSADVKKLGQGNFYRAKLDYAARLLLTFVSHDGKKACLALEVIEGHAYDRSRFLRGGAAIHEDAVAAQPPAAPEAIDAEPIRYLHPERAELHYQGKPISFDDAQARVYAARPPIILVGAAGSGKTALTLEKLRLARGDVLYVTQSPFLAENARALFAAHGYTDDGQVADFLCYRELLESIRVPPGKPVTFRDFQGFFDRHRQRLRFTDAHQCFEELRGVLGAEPEGPLSLEAYLELGVRQSIFAVEERRAVHELFQRYRAFLDESGLYDPNLVAHAWLALVTPRYDFVVVDEVQDLTNAELAVVLAALRQSGSFLLAGDANQIVHPNFFSWSRVKSLFFRDPRLAEGQRIEVLDANFRNARAVTRAANRLLALRQARFGSIDRESNTLVRPVADDEGAVEVLPDDPKVLAELDRSTSRSARFAVVVLRDEHKAEARKRFRTPLLFSAQEAKGLEYDGMVLFRFVSSERARFAEACDGVEPAAVDAAAAGEELRFARARDKTDKSLEAYKFYLNALYVALTRAVKRVYLVEGDLDHPLLELLGARRAADASGADVKASTTEEWQNEARRLERQGKDEQAEAIRRGVLGLTPLPYTVIDGAVYRALVDKAFTPRSPFNKAKQQLYAFACIHDAEGLAARLAREAAFPVARGFERDAPAALAKALAPFQAKKPDEVLSLTQRHGVDFRSPAGVTPLMLAAAAGNTALVERLVERGARRDLVDPFGRTAAMWLLRQAYRSPDIARGALGPIWDLVAPDAIDVQVDGRLIKIGREQGEHFYLLATLTLWPSLMRGRFARHSGLTTKLVGGGAFALFPDNVVRAARKRRVYQNGLFARNDVGSSYAASRKLWQRQRHGHYRFNPALELRVPDDRGAPSWRRVGELLGDSIHAEQWISQRPADLR
jgi:hypothetical protein